MTENRELKLAVGILTAKTVDIEFVKGFSAVGIFRFEAASFVPRRFEPTEPQSVFEIKNVVIGIGFHWERKENQRFTGAVELKRDEQDNIVVINHVDIEDYIKSVISSEMSASATPEFLKAHAVISRSWVLAQILAPKQSHDIPSLSSPKQPVSHLNPRDRQDEVVRWYDKEQHKLFDVCADDHCQRYQGLTRQTMPGVELAVEATRGLVLAYNGELCDARFSKCCGGATEEFRYCWEEASPGYLKAFVDAAGDKKLPDLQMENNAAEWIESRPEVFCNTSDQSILEQVLNSYDRETPDFFRWSVSYSSSVLGDLVRRKSGRDLGAIIDLQPLARGKSGRIYRLRIVGEKGSVTVGKELEIRRWLSESHLYSSAFIVRKFVDTEGNPSFRLDGAGWGHGVGLCQIGAAVMSSEGYDYRQILNHYFPGTELEHYTQLAHNERKN